MDGTERKRENDTNLDYTQLQDLEVICSELIGSNRTVFDEDIYTLLRESGRTWKDADVLGQKVIPDDVPSTISRGFNCRKVQRHPAVKLHRDPTINPSKFHPSLFNTPCC